VWKSARASSKNKYGVHRMVAMAVHPLPQPLDHVVLMRIGRQEMYHYPIPRLPELCLYLARLVDDVVASIWSRVFRNRPSATLRMKEIKSYIYGRENLCIKTYVLCGLTW
jgi:hypothetical protein